MGKIVKCERECGQWIVICWANNAHSRRTKYIYVCMSVHNETLSVVNVHPSKPINRPG